MNKKACFVVIGPYDEKKNADYVVARIRQALGLPAYLWKVPTESEARRAEQGAR